MTGKSNRLPVLNKNADIKFVITLHVNFNTTRGEKDNINNKGHKLFLLYPSTRLRQKQ